MNSEWLTFTDEFGGTSIVKASDINALETWLHPRDNPRLDKFGCRICTNGGWYFANEQLEEVKARLMEALNGAK